LIHFYKRAWRPGLQETTRARRKRRRARSREPAVQTAVATKRRGGGGTSPGRRTRRKGKQAARARAPAVTPAATPAPALLTPAGRGTRRRSRRKSRRTRSRNQAVGVLARLTRRRMVPSHHKASLPLHARKLRPLQPRRRDRHRQKSAHLARRVDLGLATDAAARARNPGIGGGAEVGEGRGVLHLSQQRSTLGG